MLLLLLLVKRFEKQKTSEVDWHMPLVQSAGDGENTSIVVETSPRVRQLHPKWTTETLSRWLNSDAPVRISGYLLLDLEHRAHLGVYRSTLWEIHPITNIEVRDGDNWVDLDRLQSRVVTQIVCNLDAILAFIRFLFGVAA